MLLTAAAQSGSAPIDGIDASEQGLTVPLSQPVTLRFWNHPTPNGRWQMQPNDAAAQIGLGKPFERELPSDGSIGFTHGEDVSFVMVKRGDQTVTFSFVDTRTGQSMHLYSDKVVRVRVR